MKLGQALYRQLAASHPSLARGEVWCTKCGAHQYVNPAKSLRWGWPRCCGFTMTIDSPEERAGRAAESRRGQ